MQIGMTVEEGINRVFDGPSHVVILGAGASVASTKYAAEKNGFALPTMKDFIEVVGLEDLCDQNPQYRDNFEKWYSHIHENNTNPHDLKEIQTRVRSYFSKLELPPTPTIYDYLVMSLRSKDMIATFNWDPFLYQAWCRNRRIGDDPHIAFLHGCVSLGRERIRGYTGPVGMFSADTNAEFEAVDLLYPVAKKDYANSEFIDKEWSRLRRFLGSAKRITIFGYGAPDTDAEAISLMSDVWGPAESRNLEQIEIIDISPEPELKERWSKFIHTHHYEVYDNYFDSTLARFPRRTGEHFMHRYLPSTLDEALQQENRIPSEFSSLSELQDWHKKLIDAEKQN